MIEDDTRTPPAPAPPAGTDETVAAASSSAPAPARGLEPALARGDALGRYVVLAKLGAGGMGIVYAAYDPELDRKVAIKILHPSAAAAEVRSEGRSRLLREAQALAKLSHPNVVVVHDVGSFGEQIYVAMEFVVGRTLREWSAASARTWPEILDVTTPAANGLAAAHAAGLVHRDFKPDNVMVGDDGRVRVMDFGLARADPRAAPEDRPPAAPPLDLELTRPGSVMGTPAYMAPEQHLGLPTDPRTDQFSFCVTLWEALYRERPFQGGSLAELALAVTEGRPRPPRDRAGTPAWLHRLLEIGLASSPEHRHASMDTLVHAIARGRARARHRWVWIAVGLVAATAGAGTLWSRARAEGRLEACAAEAGAIEASWSPEARVSLRDALVATGAPFAEDTVERLGPRIDAWTAAWRDAREQACRRTVLGEWTTTMGDASGVCLDERRWALESLLDVLGEADTSAVARAIDAAAGLEDPVDCLRAPVLERRMATTSGATPSDATDLKRAFARIRSLAHAGRFGEGLDHARQTLASARAVGSPDLVTEAALLVGTLEHDTGAYTAAEASLAAAFFDAADAGIDAVAFAAASQLAVVVGNRLTRHDDGLLWGRHAELILRRMPDRPLDAASLYDGLASVHHARGANDEAARLVRESLSIAEAALGPEHPRVANHLNNLASVLHVQGALDEAATLHERALAIRTHAFGPEHPAVAESLSNLASVDHARGNRDAARDGYERALVIRERALGPEHPDVGGSLNNLGLLASERGDHEVARRLLERALAISETSHGPNDPRVLAELNNLAIVARGRGDYDAALELDERAAAVLERSAGPDHLDYARALGSIAADHRGGGEFANALAVTERVLAIREAALGPDHPSVASSLVLRGEDLLELGRAPEALPSLERAVAVFDAREDQGEGAAPARARFALARALWLSGVDRPRARRLAEAAARARHARGDAAAAAAIDAWLAALP